MNPLNKKQSLRWLIFAVVFLSLSAASFGQLAVGVSVRFGPPPLPIYTQPVCPGAGYMWTPGYWSWDDDDGYYWVPGTWVMAPVGMLWTPGYWGWNDGYYMWNAGYWGPEVGFYGGINYGFGYTGTGFYGGEWRDGTFFYNRSVTNINVTNVTNIYSRNVAVSNNHVSYNGGRGGLTARPTARQVAYGREHHTGPIAAQAEQERAARGNHSMFASVNHGRPSIAATSRAGEFTGSHIVAARAAGGAYHAPTMSPKEARGPASRGAEKPSAARENPRNVSPRENERPTARENARPTTRENTPAAERENNTHARQQEQRQQKAEQSQAREQEQRQQKAEQSQAREQEQRQQKAEQSQARQQEQRQQKAEQSQARQQEQRQQKAEQSQAKQQEQRQQKAEQSQARQQEQRQQKAEQSQAREQEQHQQKAEQQQEKAQRSERQQQPKAEAPARQAHKQEVKPEGDGPGADR